MKEINYKIKLNFVYGLQEVAINEIKKKTNLKILKKGADFLYVDYIENFNQIISLRSISSASLCFNGKEYNPKFVSKHKEIIKNLLKKILDQKLQKFKTFKLSCAGINSPEAQSIISYIKEEFKLNESPEADFKIAIAKNNEDWEISAQLTTRPLSVREYRVKNMSGAMDPTIAYTMNSLCGLENKDSYLNIFSGSATLLIEAGLAYPSLKKLLGFDNNKKNISLAVQNIKKSGLIKKIELQEKDIFDMPNLGKFDAIVSDLPFGMVISRNEDLEKLYQCFILYCEKALNKNGNLALFTSEYVLLEKLILKSNFKIIKTLELKFITSANTYLRSKIFICKFK